MGVKQPKRRKQSLDIPKDASSEAMSIVEKQPVLAEMVNDQSGEIRENVRGEVKAASEIKRELSPEQQEKLLEKLKARFHLPTHMELHEKIDWWSVERSLKADPEKLWSLQQMELTGGEPDVIDEQRYPLAGENDVFIFGDTSPESPKQRRNVVFDKEAQQYFKDHFPNKICKGNAVDMAAEYGTDLMDTLQYHLLQKKLWVDRDSSSWLDGRYIGWRSGGSTLRVREFYPEYQRSGDCNPKRGFRTVLRVKKSPLKH